jgi:predicted metal-dependent phosphoesterase TrpH
MAMKFDMHLHTSRHSPDSIMGPFEMVRRAVEIGLDGVVITEHDWLWQEGELAELRAAAPQLVILAGIEATTHDGDLLIYGVTNPFGFRKGMRMAEACREAHRQGGVAVAAHPNRWGQPFRDILAKYHPELDGIEMMSSNMDGELRRLAVELARDFPHFARIGNSDAHDLVTLGLCYTEFEDTITDNPSLVAAIRAKRCQPRQRLATYGYAKGQ